MTREAPVRCFARVRPALEREIGDDKRLSRCVAKQPGAPVLHVSTKPGAPIIVEADGTTASSDGDNALRSFELDGAFDEDRSTAEVYEGACRELVASVLGGVNGTILCYGMTGSGKTHTMLGDGGRVEGVVDLAARQLLSPSIAAAAAAGGATSTTTTTTTTTTTSVECSFMQLCVVVLVLVLVFESKPSFFKVLTVAAARRAPASARPSS